MTAAIIGIRQGRQYRILAKYRGLDLVQLSDRVIEFIDREQPDATVIDGDGLGAGVVDIVRHRNYGRHAARISRRGECQRLRHVLQQADRGLGMDARLAEGRRRDSRRSRAGG